MREVDIISEQIRRMRMRHVEPSEITVSDEVYTKLGKPKRISGVPIECDGCLQSGWCVR